MGGTTSKKTHRVGAISKIQTPEKRETILQAYARMEAGISEAERALVAPKLLSTILEVQQLEQDLIDLKATDDKNHDMLSAQEHDDLKQVIDDLKLFQKPESALEHEEFIANINRQVIKRVTFQWTSEKKAETEKNKRTLEVQVFDLQTLYREMHLMLAKTVGGRRSTNVGGGATESHVESRLSASRALRDSLAAAALNWRSAAAESRRAAAHASAALHGWRLVPHSMSSNDRASLCAECCARVARALAGVRAASRALRPRANAPYCTPRLLRDTRSSLDYTLTDSFDTKRYETATTVISKFKDATTLLSQWINQTLKNTLEKDLNEVEGDIEKLSAELRSLRVNIIASKGLTEAFYKPPQEIKQLQKQTLTNAPRNKVSFDRSLSRDK